MPQASTRRGDPEPIRLTRFPCASREKPRVADSMRPSAWSSKPGVAGKAIQVVNARAYVSDSCARATGARSIDKAASAEQRTARASAERAIDGFGKAIILS